MKIDKRKDNGGDRPGSGPKKIAPAEKKEPITFYVKAKLRDAARAKIQPIIDKLNA